DCDDEVKVQRVDDLQHVRRQVYPLAGMPRFPLVPAQEVGGILRLDVAGVCSGRVQESATGTSNRADRHLVERHDQVLIGGAVYRLIRMVVEKASPTAPDTNRLMAGVDGPVNQGFDAGVQAGDVAAACKDSNLHASLPMSNG